MAPWTPAAARSATHQAIRAHEISDRRAFGEKLRIHAECKAGARGFSRGVFDRAPHEQKLTDPAGAMFQDMNRTTFRAESLRTVAGATDGLAVITNDLRGGLRRIVEDVSAYYVLGYYSTDRNLNGGYRRIEGGRDDVFVALVIE